MNIPTTLLQATIVSLVLAAPVHAHNHKHDHAHDHGSESIKKTAAKGYFNDTEVRDRNLSDWEGDWQSLYPLLKNGSLDTVMTHKAGQKKDRTAEGYKQYYEAGYKTDVDRLVIQDDRFTFYRHDKSASAQYKYDGYKILTYKAGNRGVRYLFTKTQGDAQAPGFIQFSDHTIAPKKVSHFHIYFGNDGHQKLSEELTNWPTYFPSGWDSQAIAHDLMHH